VPADPAKLAVERRFIRLIGARLTIGAQIPLAWRNIIDDPRRLARAMMGIAFAVTLMLVQIGLRLAFLDSATVTIRDLDGDLFVMSSQKANFTDKEDFPRSQLRQVGNVDGVASASPIYAEWTRSLWKNPQSQQSFIVQVLAFDPGRPVFLAPEIRGKLDALKQPGTVMVDSRARRFLGQASAGTETELASRRVLVVGIFSQGPNFSIDGTVLMSDRTFLTLFGTSRDGSARLDRVDLGVVKLQPGADPLRVQASLRRILPANVVVLTRDEFLQSEEDYQSSLAPIGPVFNLGTVIGFIVGMLITYQILFADLSDQLPQYATLNGMGYRKTYLLKVVLQQAALYGLCGFVPAWFLSAGLFWVARAITLLPLALTLPLTLASLALTLAMCGVSGLMVLSRVLRADPAEVF